MAHKYEFNPSTTVEGHRIYGHGDTYKAAQDGAVDKQRRAENKSDFFGR